MTNVRHSLAPCTQSDAFAEVLSAESCNIVLETSPPDYVKKISRYLDGQSGRDEAFENPAEEEDSDSGNSLFITQVPVPEAVRSRRRTAPTSPHGSEVETLLSDSDGKSKTPKRKKRFSLPKHSFVSLKEGRSRKTVLRSHQNIGLHYFAMGGFFESVRQMWQNYQREDVESSLPTIDVDGESISPISEGEEEEKSENEDIKVVPRGRLVVTSIMKKCSRPWYTPTTGESHLKQQRGKTPTNATHVTSQRGRKRPATTTVSRDTSSSGTECSDDGDSSCRTPTSERRVPDQTRTPRAKRYLAREMKRITPQKNERKDDLCNSDAIVCEPSPDGYVASAVVAEPQADVTYTDVLSQTGQAECEPETPDLLQSDTNNDTKRKRDNGDHKSVEDAKGQSPEEPEGQDAAVAIAGVTPDLSLTTDEPEPNENGDDDTPRQEKGDGSNSKQKKKKRRKRKASAAEDVRQEVDGVGEADVRVKEEPVLLANGNVDDDVEQLNSSPAAEPPNGDAEIRKKKTKRKEGSDVTSLQTSTEQLEEEREGLGNTEASQEMLEAGFVKRKKKKKHQTASNDDTQVGEGDCQDVSFSNDVTTTEESTGVLVKKKKKKKRTAERGDLSFTPEEDVNSLNTKTITEDLGEQDTEVATKKKKKKKKKKKSREISSMETASDTVAQTDDSVSAQKEEKKRTSSFLVADAEGKAAQTHEGKHPPSPSAAANVCGAENISDREFVTESAEIAAGSLEESNDGVRKKKKKKKRETSADHDPDFEEPNEMCQRTAAETGLKKKEKRKRNESESLNGMERWESSADEAAALKKEKKKKKGTPPSSIEETELETSTPHSCSSVSHKKNGLDVDSKVKHSRSTEISQVTEETLSLETPVHQPLNDVRDEKRRRKLEGKSFTRTPNAEAHKTKEEGMTETADSSFSPQLSKVPLSQLEMSTTHSNQKTKLRKAKRKLHNQSGDFLTEY